MANINVIHEITGEEAIRDSLMEEMTTKTPEYQKFIEKTEARKDFKEMEDPDLEYDEHDDR